MEKILGFLTRKRKENAPATKEPSAFTKRTLAGVQELDKQDKIAAEQAAAQQLEETRAQLEAEKNRHRPWHEQAPTGDLPIKDYTNSKY